MAGLKHRINKLEERSAGPDILETSLQESGLSSPQWHWQRAEARATPAEREELGRCITAVVKARQARQGTDTSEAERLHDPTELAMVRIMEKVMRREAPTLADDLRCRLDALYRELDRLRDEWETQGRNRSTSYSDPAYWNLSTAEVNRRTVIRQGGPLIEDPEQAARIVERITDSATTLDEVFELIGWWR